MSEINDNIISIVQIIDLITNKYGFEKSVVERFVRSLFVNFENALINDGFVEVKGLGNFQKINSLDERVKYSLTYTPDSDLKELINRPFSHLQTINLNVPDFEENKVVIQPKNEIKTITPKEPMSVFQNQAEEIKEILSEIGSLNKVNSHTKTNNLINKEVENKSESTTETHHSDIIFEQDNRIKEEIEGAVINDNIISENIEDNKLNIIEEQKKEIVGNNVYKDKSELLEKDVEELEKENSEPILNTRFDDELSNFDQATSFEEKELDIQDKSRDIKDESNIVENFQKTDEQNVEQDDFDVVYVVSNQPKPERYKEKKVEQEDIDLEQEDKIAHLIYDENIIDSNVNSIDDVEGKSNEDVILKTKLDEKEKVVDEKDKYPFIYKKDEERKGFSIRTLFLILFSFLFILLLLFFSILTNHFKQQKEQQRINYIIDSIYNVNKINRIKDSLNTINNFRNYSTSTGLNFDGELDTNLNKKEKNNQKTKNIFEKKRTYNQFVTTIRVKSGDRLRDIAQKYYGEAKFWVYIYEANKNKIKSPNVLSVGSRVNIPKLNKKLIDKNNPKCIEYASQLENKYLK